MTNMDPPGTDFPGNIRTPYEVRGCPIGDSLSSWDSSHLKGVYVNLNGAHIYTLIHILRGWVLPWGDAFNTHSYHRCFTEVDFLFVRYKGTFVWEQRAVVLVFFAIQEVLLSTAINTQVILNFPVSCFSQSSPVGSQTSSKIVIRPPFFYTSNP